MPEPTITAVGETPATSRSETPSSAVNPAHNPTPGGALDDGQLAKLREEAAAKRHEAKSLKAERDALAKELEALRASAAQSEAERLKARGEWETVAKKATDELATTQKQVALYREKLREQALRGTLSSKLAALGHTGPRADLIIRAVRQDLQVEWDANDSPSGDFDGVLKAAIDALQIAPPAPPASTTPPVVSLAGYGRPTDSPAQSNGGIRGITARLAEAISRG